MEPGFICLYCFKNVNKIKISHLVAVLSALVWVFRLVFFFFFNSRYSMSVGCSLLAAAPLFALEPALTEDREFDRQIRFQVAWWVCLPSPGHMSFSLGWFEMNHIPPSVPFLLQPVSHTLCLSFSFTVQGDTASCDRNLAFNISWYLRSSVCYNEVFNTPVSIRWGLTMN